MSSALAPYIIRSYAEAKRRYPTEGRRRWKLRAAQQFWTTISSGDAVSLSQPDGDSDVSMSLGISPSYTGKSDSKGASSGPRESDSDSDPLDGVTHDTPELGLVVRTDFSDEPSWTAFCTRLQDSEKELVLGDVDADSGDALKQPEGVTVDEEGSDGEEEGAPPAIFNIISPPPQERELLTNASNLAILRLFNDVDIRPSPTPPRGSRRIDLPNKLVDYRGWQEVYQGKNVWIYDAKSNTDQCVRVVSQSGDMYGTATGDSWRARVSHICELQVNLSSGAIRIDFGGLDRWDLHERRRNMVEAEGV